VGAGLSVRPRFHQRHQAVRLNRARAHRQYANAETGTDATWRDYMSGLPMGRAANVDEVADAIAFLVSERASYISGTVLTIDGGHGSRGGSFTK
ncbi:MAG: SDR family oxidoreductase, partial [Pseudomonadota bacterium]